MRFSYLFSSILLGVLAWGCQQQATVEKTPLFNDSTSVFFEAALKPFYHGVASGDPLPDRVIIWTRVTPDYVDSLTVSWKMATDEGMTQVVQSGQEVTGQDRDFTVKVDVTGLQPDTYYYYQFEWNGAKSLVGRTKTTPTDAREQLKLAFISCSNYEAGYFNAYARLAEQDSLDAVVHLGDYIYEYGARGYGDTTLQRIHLPHHEIVSLQDYRTRYAEYRLDKDLREAHRLHPFITIWDDHEVANDSYVTGAQNHQPDQEGSYEDRKKSAVQAYFEWLPIRDNPEYQIYRPLSFGPLAELFMLDTRLEGRVEQADSVDQPNLADESRTILGAEQYNWLTSSLVGSQATWRLIGNQVIFSDLDVTPLRWRNTKNLDSWDGYPSEKKKLIGFLDQNKVNNVVFLTGDTHSSWAFEVSKGLKEYNAKTGTGAVAVEFGTPSISSSNADERYPTDSVKLAEKVLMAPQLNPHLKYANLRDHGYLVLTLTPEQAVAEWYYVDKLNAPSNGQTLAQRYVVKNGATKLVQ